MDLSYHRYRSVEKFSHAYEDLHRWLDHYYKNFQDLHRVVLHHRAGLGLVEQKFGAPAVPVAELHLKDDFDGQLPEGPREVAQMYAPPQRPDMARGLVEELRRLYGTDFGLGETWNVED